MKKIIMETKKDREFFENVTFASLVIWFLIIASISVVRLVTKLIE